MVRSFIVVACVIGTALGHGSLNWPPSRSSMWKHGFDNPPNYNDYELNCGGFEHQFEKNDGKCGECGDAWDIPVGQRENQAGGKYANGIISDTYTSGQMIDVEVDMMANHDGWFEFRLCVNNDVNKPITDDCLNQHLLQFEDGSTRWTLPNKDSGMIYLTLKLPAGVTCSQCVLQWKWVCANRWGCEDDGYCCVGCGNIQEEFYGCSDIAIV